MMQTEAPQTPTANLVTHNTDSQNLRKTVKESKPRVVTGSPLYYEVSDKSCWPPLPLRNLLSCTANLSTSLPSTGS